jgi:hypothetical protein
VVFYIADDYSEVYSAEHCVYMNHKRDFCRVPPLLTHKPSVPSGLFAGNLCSFEESKIRGVGVNDKFVTLRSVFARIRICR